jgi:glycosyltransferase involved in cell wall biosynthesis
MVNTQQNKTVSNPLVSIIMGNYNYERFLKEAIDSALKQTYRNIEIIVVDDGSKDQSRNIIASYGEQIIPILKENGGQPSNYNAGFASSKGEIICFLDSDDMFLPNKVEEIVKIFDSFEDIGWCFHSLKLIDENSNLLPKTTTVNYFSRKCDFRFRLKAGKIPPSLPPSSTLCFRRSLLEKILPMPTTKAMPGSDHYVKFMAVALSQGFILDEPLTLQRIHGNNMGTLRKDIQYMKARELLFTGHWIRQQFPQFHKFANKIYAVGISINKKSGKLDSDNKNFIDTYFRSISWNEKVLVILIATYHSFFKDTINALRSPLQYRKQN